MAPRLLDDALRDALAAQAAALYETMEYRPVAVAYIEDRAGNLLLVRSAKGLHWGPVQGGIERGEGVCEAVFREVAEETGIPRDVLVGLQYLGTDRLDLPKPSRGFSRGKHYFHLHLILKYPAAVVLDPEELAEYEWAAPKRVPELAALADPQKQASIMAMWPLARGARELWLMGRDK